MPKLDKHTLTPQQFQTLLLRWFDQHGRKQLPWQMNKTPYRVWVSEIMLQQTQVMTVIPYYERFMAQFPTVFDLAKASDDHVMHAWAGLGYYSRARNLHRAAKMVVEQWQGQFPAETDNLCSLPGIGLSTAGAITAIAFNQRAAILDGNVKRVLTRLHAIEEPINQKLVENKLWRLADHYTPTDRIADYTQAMMDLGATVCTRSKPQCDICPLVKHCQAKQKALTHTLPIKKAAPTLPIRSATFLILKQNADILLYKRDGAGVWKGLWALPEIKGNPTKKAIEQFCKEELGIRVKTYQSLNYFRHTFSHYHLDIHPILIDIDKKSRPSMESAQQIWYNPAKPVSIGLPKPIQTILRGLA